MSAMKKIQQRAREIKKEDPEIKHKDAIKKAAEQLREEGVFKSKPKAKPKSKTENIPDERPKRTKRQVRRDKRDAARIRKKPTSTPIFKLSSFVSAPQITELTKSNNKPTTERLKKLKTRGSKFTSKDLLSDPAIKSLIGTRRKF